MSPKDKVSFAAPNGLVNTGVVLSVVDGVAAVAVDVPIVTFPVGELTVLKPAPQDIAAPLFPQQQPQQPTEPPPAVELPPTPPSN